MEETQEMGMREMQCLPELLMDINRCFVARTFRLAPLPVALILAAGVLPFAGCNRGHNADVVATVNGHAIMQADVEKAYKLQLGDPAQQQPSQEQADSLRL